MDKEFKKRDKNHKSFGYALHKLICDENGIPYDYELFEVFPRIRDGGLNFATLLEELSLNKRGQEIDVDNVPLKESYRVHVYSTKNSKYIIILNLYQYNLSDMNQHVALR